MLTKEFTMMYIVQPPWMNEIFQCDSNSVELLMEKWNRSCDFDALFGNSDFHHKIIAVAQWVFNEALTFERWSIKRWPLNTGRKVSLQQLHIYSSKSVSAPHLSSGQSNAFSSIEFQVSNWKRSNDHKFMLRKNQLRFIRVHLQLCHFVDHHCLSFSLNFSFLLISY